MGRDDRDVVLREAFARMEGGRELAPGIPGVPTWQPWYTPAFPVAWPPGEDRRTVTYAMASSREGIVDAERIAGPWAAITVDGATGERTVELLADELVAVGTRGVRPLTAREKEAREVLAGTNGQLEAWVTSGEPPPDPELLRMSWRRMAYQDAGIEGLLADRHPAFRAWLEEGDGTAAYRTWVDQGRYPGLPRLRAEPPPPPVRVGPGGVEPRRRRAQRWLQAKLGRLPVCAGCGTVNPRQRRFCRRCGDSLGR